MATSGTDGLIKFWDLRSAKQPTLVCRGGHSHWASNVQYNPFHDQLVLSTGTDTLANLWRISSISSAPLLDSDPTANADKRVKTFEHSDACYTSAWGAADAWIYLTVGYEGKVVLHHVPSKEKYKILL
uniref:EIPR1-like beta-propeller domain-containing protein n=1 Tax=Entomoneis paludosa TaxID=265537 RepID=A0A7S2YML3_9STRA